MQITLEQLLYGIFSNIKNACINIHELDYYKRAIITKYKKVTIDIKPKDFKILFDTNLFYNIDENIFIRDRKLLKIIKKSIPLNILKILNNNEYIRTMTI